MDYTVTEYDSPKRRLYEFVNAVGNLSVNGKYLRSLHNNQFYSDICSLLFGKCVI